MRHNGQEPVKFEDIKVSVLVAASEVQECSFSLQDEIYDMVKPAHPLHITLQDLITRYDASGSSFVVRSAFDLSNVAACM